MKAFTFTYLHVPPQYKIAMGLDTVQQKTVTINATTKAEAQRLFNQMMDF